MRSLLRTTLRTTLLTVSLSALFSGQAIRAQLPAPERIVRGHSLVSLRDPQLTIALPSTATYVGARRWLLFGVADCEVHVFVEADTQKRVERFYYIQFESFMPSHPDLAYDYASKRPDEVTKDGMQFYVRPNFGPSSDPSTPGSEQETVYKLIADAGYTLPAHFINVRLVNVLDAAKRKELLIYYIEDLAPTGFTTETIIKDRVNNVLVPEWAGLASGVKQRALERISISRP